MPRASCTSLLASRWKRVRPLPSSRHCGRPCSSAASPRGSLFSLWPRTSHAFCGHPLLQRGKSASLEVLNFSNAPVSSRLAVPCNLGAGASPGGS